MARIAKVSMSIDDYAMDFVAKGNRLDQYKSKVVGKGENKYVVYAGVKLRWSSLCKAYWKAVNEAEADDLIG